MTHPKIAEEARQMLSNICSDLESGIILTYDLEPYLSQLMSMVQAKLDIAQEVGIVWVNSDGKRVRVVDVKSGITFVDTRIADFNGVNMDNMSFLEFKSIYSPA